jgi:hypothetical protein
MIGQIQAGSIDNAIPETARLTGVRSVSGNRARKHSE